MARNKLEIIHDILKSINTPKRLTRIMYDTNVNCTVLKSILNELIEKEFCKIQSNPNLKQNQMPNPKRPFYIITLKGIELLKSMSNVQKIYGEPLLQGVT